MHTNFILCVNTQLKSLEVRLQCEMEDVISPSDTENTPCYSDPSGLSPQPQPPSPRSNTPDSTRDSIPCLKLDYTKITIFYDFILYVGLDGTLLAYLLDNTIYALQFFFFNICTTTIRFNESLTIKLGSTLN